MPEENIAGPTVLWSELEDKKVKSNDGKKLGRIKRISQNHFRLEKGSIKKKEFWVPKDLADAFDGKYLWLSNDEDSIHDKFLYGEEPPEGENTTAVDRVRMVKERMRGIPTNSDRYKNTRDLK
ncbi:MAG TPA: hypothetical protein VJ599_08260 [Nitrososphaeraceae archaeon]|nr:hypothetical protein [Nitrososphaeraceae archaeon]